jgi:Na+-transporting methylmalonyl-CoA/oxaloacetate decarboxylase gamma subunit
MSNHSELRGLRSKGIHFKNKYKLMMLKSTMMPQIKKEFDESEHKYKIYITISIRLLFWSLVYRHSNFKKMAFLFVLSLLISGLTFVLLLLSLLASALPDMRKIFFRFMSENNCSHKHMLQNIKHIWRTNSTTSGHETAVC